MFVYAGNEKVDKDRFISIMSNYAKTRQRKKRYLLRFTWMNML